jgi:AraC-like DNA-binding protein
MSAWLQIDTANIAPPDRGEYWRASVCDQFVPLAVKPDAVVLHGRVAGGDIAETGVRRIRATRHVFERRAKDVRAGDPEVLQLLLVDHGGTRVEQDGRTADLTPGDLLLYDSTRPYRFETAGDFQFTICLLPKRLLPVPESLQRNSTARVFKSDDGVAAALAPLLTALARRTSDTEPSQQLALQHAMVNMYVALMADEKDSGHHPSVHLSLAKSFVVRNLGNSKLSPSDVAGACNISPSYLHRLFAADGITVSGYMREQRLQAAYRDLVAPSFAEPISRVAERWGLPDPAHFNRVFKGRFGVTPGELRRGPKS